MAHNSDDMAAPQAILASLALPPLAGKKFLDIACGDGYYCGYAFFDAAAKVIGIEARGSLLARAKASFPQCGFICANYESALVELAEKFDVILSSGAFDLAPDKKAFLNLVMSKLNPGGVAVLLIRMAEQNSSGWLQVEDKGAILTIPDWNAVTRLFSAWTYKYMGQAPAHAGSLHVFHLQNPLPVAILLMGAPGSGKSTLAAKLATNLKLLCGDALVCSIGGQHRYPLLRELGQTEISFARIDILTRRIFETGAWREYAQMVHDAAAGQDFIFDGYIPDGFRQLFAEEIARLGAKVFLLDAPAPQFSPNELSRRARQEARKYQMFLGAMEHAKRR